MTTPNHIAQGLTIAHLIYPNLYHYIFAAVLSSLPDISIWYQRCKIYLIKIYNLFTVNKITVPENNWNGFYLWAHTSPVMNYIPYANLHKLEDSFVHDKNGGMNKYYKPAEYSSWELLLIVNVVVFHKYLITVLGL